MHTKNFCLPVRSAFFAILMLVAIIAAVAVTFSTALAQEGDAAGASARLYLPVLANGAGSAAQVLVDTPAIGVAASGNIDGEWSNPRSDLDVTPVTCQDIANSPEDDTNENIVRYGRPISSADCGNVVFRSGFGFDGSNMATFAPNQPFILGQFTHYNANIDTPPIPMQFVDLAIRVQIAEPAVDVSMNYTMQLDETLNDGSCPYGSSNEDLCDDRVDFINNTPAQTLVVNGVTYTLNIIGFVPGTPETCQYADTMVDYFITGELIRNDACIFARFVEPALAIALSKSPDVQQIDAGDYAEFSITVTNAGNVGLERVNVSDPLTPDCDQAIGDLKAGAAVTYTCTAYNVERDFENEATATGVFAGNTYAARDLALVDVIAPDTATVFAIKYHDQNSNGQRDPGEPGLAGWTLCLRDASGAAIGFCRTTDITGAATLAPNQAGVFQLCEVLQDGWTNTDPGDATACKPVNATAAPAYAEFAATTTDIYGVELTAKSSDQLSWTYTVYQFLTSDNLDAWVLALPACIDAAQIDPVSTTAGWSLVTDPGAGLRGIRWPTPGGVLSTGSAFTVALRQAYATGAAGAGITAGGEAPVSATQPVAGPVCDSPVLLGNTTTTAAMGALEVRKVVLPATDSGSFNLSIDATIFATDIGNGGSTGSQPVVAGMHSIGESAGAQTTLTDYQATARCVETRSGSSWTPGADGVVYVNAGEAVVCTFTNVRLGALTVVKEVSGSATADWNFAGSLGAFTLPANGGQRTFAGLAPGSYSVAEQMPAGWGLGLLTCVDPTFNSQTSLATATATINLEPGETVICTFSNVANAGTITIVKQVNGVATAPWFFDGALGAFSVDAAGGTRRFENVAPGSYTIRELATPDWRVSAIICTDPDNGSASNPGAATASVDLDAGEAITCTFVNEPGEAMIALEKIADTTIVYPGTVATYAFAVTNVGQVPLSAVRIDDPLCTATPILSEANNIGDSNGDGLLDNGESWRFTCAVALTKDTTNVAIAWGTAPWGEEVWATDSVFVDVIAPKITLAKDVSRALVSVGETVNFQIVVGNSGDSPLTNIVVEDGLPACALGIPTGDNGNSVLDPAEQWTYTCTMAITTDTINTATVEGYDALNNRWTAADSASVKVMRPAIEILKRTDHAYVYPGEYIHFALDVRNTGNTVLHDVTVTDTLPECVLSSPIGDDGDGQLAIAEVWSYSCSVPVCEGEYFPLPGATQIAVASASSALCGDVTNTGMVTAKDPAGQSVSDEDTVFVDLIRPALQVIKLADKTEISPGEEVNFNIFVKNIGDTELTDVTLTDSLAACTLIGPAGDDGDSALSSDEEWTYICSVVLEEETVNTAQATAKDPRSTIWRDEDSVTIHLCID